MRFMYVDRMLVTSERTGLAGELWLRFGIL